MSLVCTIILLIAAAVIEPGVERPPAQTLSQYVPSTGEVEEWEAVGAPQVFAGESLYAYINGGATIYYEYGFNQVIIQQYAYPDGRIITLEIFEMTSSAGAYGVYTFKTRGDSQAVAVGSEALLGDYYANFWKSTFVVTLKASDSTEETIHHMLALAQIVDSKIAQKAVRPALVDLMPHELAEPTSIVYVKGNTALTSVSSFFSEDIFGVSEGVVGDYGGLSIFIFKYSTNSKSSKWFENAREHFSKSDRVVRFMDGDGMFSFANTEKQHISVRQCENYVLVSLWKSASINPHAVLQLIEEKIREPR